MAKNETNETMATYIKRLVDEGASNLRPFVIQQQLNAEFISGKQNKKVNKQRLTIEDKKFAPNLYTERKTFNRLLPIYLTRYGILSQNMPIPGMQATSASAKEVSDALKINDFIKDYLAVTNFKDLYSKAIKNLEIAGLYWFKTGIDWSTGREIADVEMSINETPGKMKLREGRVFTMGVPFHEIFIDNLHIDSMDDVNELIHRRAFHIDYIKARYGFDAKAESIVETKLPRAPKVATAGFKMTHTTEYAYVYEYYKKPDALYPKGRFTIVCNDATIHDGILPYENGYGGRRKIPFDFINIQPMPEHVVGVTVYSQLIPVQETYNAAKNRYLEYINHTAIGQLYYWEGSIANPNSFTTKPGKLIKLKRNSRPPEPVRKERLTNEFISYLNDLKEDMLDIAGLSAMAAHGKTTSNIRSDGVADKVSESDENKLVDALDTISNALIRIFKKIIYLEQARSETLYQQLKLAKVDNYRLRYNLSDVSPEQIVIVNREFLMRSDQYIEGKLRQAHEFGLYSHESGLSYSSKVEMLSALQANSLKDTLDPLERSTHDMCIEEHRELLDTMIVPDAEPYHVHAQHIVEHTLFRISPEVRKLKLEDKDKYVALQQAIDAHIQMHETQMQGEQEEDVLNNAKAAMGTVNQDQGPN